MEHGAHRQQALQVDVPERPEYTDHWRSVLATWAVTTGPLSARFANIPEECKGYLLATDEKGQPPPSGIEAYLVFAAWFTVGQGIRPCITTPQEIQWLHAICVFEDAMLELRDAQIIAQVNCNMWGAPDIAGPLSSYLTRFAQLQRERHGAFSDNPLQWPRLADASTPNADQPPPPTPFRPRGTSDRTPGGLIVPPSATRPRNAPPIEPPTADDLRPGSAEIPEAFRDTDQPSSPGAPLASDPPPSSPPPSEEPPP